MPLIRTTTLSNKTHNMRTVIIATAASLGTACAPNPVGDWDGISIFQAEDGGEYINEMSVFDGGSFDATLYIILEEPGDDPVDEPGDDPTDPLYYVAVTSFDGNWSVSGGVAIFELNCTWDNCGFNTTMSCEFEKDSGMLCDASPDYYLVDEVLLQWKRR